MKRALLLGLVAAVAMAGCATPAPSPSHPSTSTAAPASPVATTPASSAGASASAAPASLVPASQDRVTVVSGLDHPWSIVFLPDGTFLLTQRASRQITRVTAAGRTPEPVGQIDEVVPAYEGGMLGLALSPSFATDGFVYLYETTQDDERIVRLRWTGSRLERDRDIITAIPKGAMYHHGGRIAFGPDGKLYAGTGDAKRGELSQDTTSWAGKILRLNPDGSIPPDNPFGNPVWSYGHRNVQGLAWDEQGRLVASELGEKTFDELNIIEKGRNYGWPVVEGPGDGGQGMIPPVATWNPTSTCSPSGIGIAGSTVYVGCLAGEQVSTVAWDGARAGTPQTLLSDLGRIRLVTPGPDGRMWVLTDNGSDDRVIVLPK